MKNLNLKKIIKNYKNLKIMKIMKIIGEGRKMQLGASTKEYFGVLSYI